MTDVRIPDFPLTSAIKNFVVTSEIDGEEVGGRRATPQTVGALLGGVLLGDAAGIVFAYNFGAHKDADGATNTGAIQEAHDFVREQYGGGILVLPPGELALAASTYGVNYSNAGVPYASSAICLVRRSGVLIIGAGPVVTTLAPEDPILTCIAEVSCDGGGIARLGIDGGWEVGDTENGHGILGLLASDDPAAAIYRNNVHEDLLIQNVGSYGDGGGQNGDIINNTWTRIHTKNTGADGIDVKQRGPAEINQGNFVDRFFAQEFGLRASLSGQAGVDLHGAAVASNIEVEFTADTGEDKFGIRARTQGVDTGESARGCSVTNWLVRINPASGGGGGTSYGFVSGSQDVKVGPGTVWGGDVGVILTGNVTGLAEDNIVEGVTAIGCSTYGFHVDTGLPRARLIGCTAVGCDVGFRNEGDGTTYIACQAPGSITAEATASAGASLTERREASFGTHGERHDSAAGVLTKKIVSTEANVDYRFEALGTGGHEFRVNGLRAARIDNPAGTIVSWATLGGAVVDEAITFGAAGSPDHISVRLVPKGSGGRLLIPINCVPEYADDAAAAAAGLPVNGVYRTGSILKIRVA